VPSLRAKKQCGSSLAAYRDASTPPAIPQYQHRVTLALTCLEGPALRAAIPALADVLLDAVAGGASVSFMADLTRADAEAFWDGVARSADRGERRVLVATLDGEVAGTAQLVLDTPPNQPHRADVAKVLVHRRARRRGVARALMSAIETEAIAQRRTLLVLDTITGGAAESLYATSGWTKVGIIPDYALMPDGALAATTVFYKRV
jgi:GNAT superfamily N-acetyltransferase